MHPESQLPLSRTTFLGRWISAIMGPGPWGRDIVLRWLPWERRKDCKPSVLSGTDAFQLVDDSITVLYPGHQIKDLEAYDP